MRRLALLFTLALLLVTESVFADDPLFPWNRTPDQQRDSGMLKRIDEWLAYGDLDRLADPNSTASRFRDNLRMTVDIAGRGIVPTRADNSGSGSVAFIGLDVHNCLLYTSPSPRD